jgi:hypothetical protein
MSNWGPELETELKKVMSAAMQPVDSSNPDVFKFNITMYTVSFVLCVMKAKSVYLIQFINGRKATDPIHVGSDVLNTKTMVGQIRVYAQSLTKGWSDWHFWLSDAFADANIELDQYLGCEVEHDHFQVLMSKNGKQCYFIISYMPDTATTYSLKSCPEKNDIQTCPEIIDTGNLHVDKIVAYVLSAFQSISSIGGGPSRLISPQGNENMPHNSQSNQPAQDSDSSQLAKMRLYEAIVELLIAVHANKNHLDDEEVLKLLQEAKKAFRR